MYVVGPDVAGKSGFLAAGYMYLSTGEFTYMTLT